MRCHIFIIFILFLTFGCTSEEISPLFNKLSPEQTGIDFSNTISTSENLNIQSHPFVYNGGGVAVGDVTGNGLPDIYLAGNQVSSRLYLNKGSMQFEDVTESAGVSTDV